MTAESIQLEDILLYNKNVSKNKVTFLQISIFQNQLLLM